MNRILRIGVALVVVPVGGWTAAPDGGLGGIPGDEERIHDVGEVSVFTTNLGHVGGPLASGELAVGWRGYEMLNVAALWVGARTAAGDTLVSTGWPDYELRPHGPQHIYETHEGAEGGNRVGRSENADDDLDGSIDEDPFDGVDNDGDTLIDEDFAAISDEMFVTDYDDTSDLVGAPHEPLGLVVQEESYAWSQEGLGEMVAFHVTITNAGEEPLHDVVAGWFVDPDLGDDAAPDFHLDDGIGYTAIDTVVTDPSRGPSCESLPLRMHLAYAFDVPDEGEGPGDVPGFLGLLLLDHSLNQEGEALPFPRTVRVIVGGETFPDGGDPTNDLERYEIMTGDGFPVRATLSPRDYRFYLGVGPHDELAPDASVSFTVALVTGEGYVSPEGTPDPKRGADGLPSQVSLVANAVRAMHLFEGRWIDVDGIAATGVSGRETCLLDLAPEGAESITWTDPCGGGTSTIPLSSCEAPDMWVDNDCDGCTPACITDGCETLVHWWPDDIGVPIAPGSFRAERVGSSVRLTWTASGDVDRIGFDVHRLGTDGSRSRINRTPIRGEGSAFTFVDPAAPRGVVQYLLSETLADGAVSWFGPVQVGGIPSVGVGRLASRPNPFSASTVMRIEVDGPGEVRLGIYDVAGRLVRRLIDRTVGEPGVVEQLWDGRDGSGHEVVSGVYYGVLEVGGKRAAIRIVRAR